MVTLALTKVCRESRLAGQAEVKMLEFELARSPPSSFHTSFPFHSSTDMHPFPL